MNMQDHSTSVEWRYVVPPSNTARVVIMQRKDGPFRKDEQSSKGHYYVSVERLVGGNWQHVVGSSSGGYSRFEIAMRAAERVFEDLLPRAF